MADVKKVEGCQERSESGIMQDSLILIWSTNSLELNTAELESVLTSLV